MQQLLVEKLFRYREKLDLLDQIEALGAADKPNNRSLKTSTTANSRL